MLKHGSVIRPTIYLASMDIKTAFDVARPKHIAQIMEGHDVRGWIIAALFREMAGLEGQATFECVDSKFSFARRIRQWSVEAPRLWLKMARQIPGNVEPEWAGKGMGVILDLGGQRSSSNTQLYVGRQILDCVSLKGACGTDHEGSD